MVNNNNSNLIFFNSKLNNIKSKIIKYDINESIVNNNNSDNNK